MARRGIAAFGVALLIVAAGCVRENDEPSHSRVAPQPKIREGGTERPSKLVVGLTPFLPESELKREFGALVEFIGQQVGIPTEIKRAESYAAMGVLFRNYEIHLAVLSPFAYVRSKREVPDLILLATQIAHGSSTYAGYIVVRDDSPFETVDDLKGKRFLYVDRNSASGYLYPLAYLRGLGHEPEKFFASLGFSGNHAALVDKVLSRHADAGALASPVFRMARTEKAEGKRLRILAKTGRIPFDAYCASPRLDQRIVDRARSALLGLSTRTEEGRRVLGGLASINGFVAVGDDHYDEVRRVARLIEEGVGVPP